MMKRTERKTTLKSLPKALSGIQGLDDITDGGLPKGRPTLVCGNAGCGKTLFAMEFLVRGATLFNEPGVFMAFEETAEELSTNVTSLGFDLDDLVSQNKLILDHVHIERSEIEETGEYDLEGLFIRLNYAIDAIGAKRVVIDTLETLFGGLPNQEILRAELRRLFRWLKDKGVTAIITGERGEGTLTRHGLEEYVSDCVIVLDNRVEEQISTRRLRIVKYRGSTHGTNEYPFLIGDDGFSILPITSVGLSHKVSTDRISSGVPRLDTMLEGKGFYRGSSIMVSGTSGTGKTSLAAHISYAACERGEKVLFFAMEESPDQIMRNMRSIGINFELFQKKGLIKFISQRPTNYGLETFLTEMHKSVTDFKPQLVVIDPISSFVLGNNVNEAKGMVMQMVDFLKMNEITGFFTALVTVGENIEHTTINISSLIDTWLLLRDLELNGERNRGLYILKSRGMSHSNQIREFVLTGHGIELLDVYVGKDGVLTGSSRISQEAREVTEQLLRQQEIERKRLELDRKQKALEAQILLLQSEYETTKLDLMKSIELEEALVKQAVLDKKDIAKSRMADF